MFFCPDNRFFRKVRVLAVKGIIFDLDGTLVDTLDDLTDSMNFGLLKLGFPARSADECREMIGHGLTNFAEEALGTADRGSRDKLLEVMTAHYRENCLRKTRVYDGVGYVVKVLKNKGIRLGVLTNKNQEPAEAIVRHYFGANLFEPVAGYAPGRAVKPEPGGVFEILEAWQLGADEAVLAGDSEADVKVAAAARVQFLGCEWGFRSRKELVEAGAERVISRPEEILDFFNAGQR